MNLPDNIKQMGGIEDTLRIYMEDYVYTYICRYAKTGGSKEKLGILVGQHFYEEGKSVVLISGFIQAKNTLPNGGNEAFTAESRKYIEEAKNTYFKDLEILGWVHTQPGFGTFLMSRDELFHKEYFGGSHQLLYVFDPAEKIDTFYIKSPESESLIAAKGYFIYYDSNDAMQDYMIDNSLGKPKEPKASFEDAPKKSIFPSLKKAPSPVSSDIAVQSRQKLKKRSSAESQKRKLGILGTVSAMLCASCIMICLNVMNHSERIRNLEEELTSGTLSAPTATVFASQEDIDFAENSENPPLSFEEEEEKSQPVSASLEETADISQSSLPDYYIVEKGDSLSYISRRFYGDDSKIKEIMTLNSITDSDKIYYGKKLLLP